MNREKSNSYNYVNVGQKSYPYINRAMDLVLELTVPLYFIDGFRFSQ